MTYTVIARKWRPQTFEEVTGQEAITRTLRNAVEFERLHHAYLFSGARGVGKTTTARLLAKALNCHKTTKPNPVPCEPADADACVSCREIAEGRSIDVLEFDAASHTKVEEIRDIILESINVSAARDRYKVFIIDEVHMLSTSSFNALLKTLEEPPPNVVFVMATTELHKVPDTILSRCQEFQFRTIPLQKIYDRLKIIAEAEEIDIADGALREVARAGEGSMRDAQSAFDQVISFSGESIEISNVVTALGIADTKILTRVVEAIIEKNPAEALQTVDELIARGQDLRSFCRDLMSLFRDLLIVKTAPDAENLFDSALMNHDELLKFAEPFTEADFIRFFSVISDTETKLREATQPRYVLEIGLVKLIEMRRIAPLEKILERLTQLENSLANGNFPAEITTNIPENAPPKNSAPVEKKKLAIDFPLDEVPFPTASRDESESAAEKKPELTEPEYFSDYQLDENLTAAPPVEDSPPKSSVNEIIAEIIDTAAYNLPPILSEELEHFDDKWLDARYEKILDESGDKLYPLGEIGIIVKILLAQEFVNPQFQVSDETVAEPENAFPVGGGGVAFAPARETIPSIMPIDESDADSDEIPELPENATEQEIRQFAENHPLTKKMRRIFGVKIVAVERK